VVYSPQRPPIAEPPYERIFTFSYGERETIAYIAGFILFRVAIKLASEEDMDGRWSEMLARVCSDPERVATAAGVLVRKPV
jgi:hypothetical protein